MSNVKVLAGDIFEGDYSIKMDGVGIRHLNLSSELRRSLSIKRSEISRS